MMSVMFTVHLYGGLCIRILADSVFLGVQSRIVRNEECTKWR